MKIREIMTDQIIFVSTDDTVEKAAQLMEQNDIGSLPVCEGDRVVGMITDRDIVIREVAKGEGTSQTVAGIMTHDPVLGSPDMDVQEAAELMSNNQIRRLPVVEKGTLVGMVSLGDISTEPTMKETAGEALNDISQKGQGVVS
jgi:CBS domain-containing protein